jgi:hypothetical protein
LITAGLGVESLGATLVGLMTAGPAGPGLAAGLGVGAPGRATGRDVRTAGLAGAGGGLAAMAGGEPSAIGEGADLMTASIVRSGVGCGMVLGSRSALFARPQAAIPRATIATAMRRFHRAR